MVILELVQPTESDARLIMQWRNDPSTLRNSCHTKPKVWESFYPEFLKTYFCFPDLPPLFVTVDGERSAFLRFEPVLHPADPLLRCCEVGINVAPAQRGKGVGEKALLAIQPWLKRQGFDAILARIRVENTISQHLFEKVGFQKVDQIESSIEDIDETAQLFRYILNLAERRRKVFIIAEAGSNWRVGTEQENWVMALRMIEAAKASGADAIKFQTFRGGTIYVPNAGSADYLESNEGMQELYQKLEMPYETIPKLYAACQKAGIEFMSSVFSPDDFAAVDPYVKRNKIASYEIGHTHLLRLAAESGKPLILSTGGSTEFDIAWAVDTFHSFGGSDLTLLQCTARYPAEPNSLNLNCIKWLKQRFNTKSGLSDHSSASLTAPVAAVALGAVVVEKHFTMDRGLPGPDHPFSLNPVELKAMVKAIRETEVMLGQEVKTIHPVERELCLFAKRGIQATRPIAKGEIFREGVNIAFLRPGKQPLGLAPRYLDRIEGKPAKRAIGLGEGIRKGDF